MARKTIKATIFLTRNAFGGICIDGMYTYGTANIWCDRMDCTGFTEKEAIARWRRTYNFVGKHIEIAYSVEY